MYPDPVPPAARAGSPSPRTTSPLFFRQHYLACLSQASYVVADRETGRAVVVDPQRDVGLYLADARAEGLRIERIVETHVHADFLSGHLELAAATGAPICYGPGARAEFPIETLTDGQVLDLGTVALEIRHTPGHTPESICVVVHDRPGAQAWGVLTGDTLFIGDVGRPDLLGGAGWSADSLARALYRSTRERLLTLPDAVRVYPAHGAGSACGKSLSTETSSTIGEQRRTNYALAPMSEDAFVAAVTDGQSPPPAYFAHVSRRNRTTHALLDQDVPVPLLSLDRLDDDVRAGAVLLDTRGPDDFAASHLAGSLNVGLDGRFAETAGHVIAADAALVLIADPSTVTEARDRLARIGFDDVRGALAGGITAVPTDRLATVGRADAAELAARLADDRARIRLLDVRGPAEIAATGLVPDATRIPLPELVARLDELDPAAPTVVYCAGGYRSSVAASLLRARGLARVEDLRGGFAAWNDGHRPVTPARPAPPRALPSRARSAQEPCAG